MRAPPDRAVGAEAEDGQDAEDEERRIVFGEHRKPGGERGAVEGGEGRPPGSSDRIEGDAQAHRGERQQRQQQMVVEGHRGEHEDQWRREGREHRFGCAQGDAVAAQALHPPEQAADQDCGGKEGRDTEREEAAAEEVERQPLQPGLKRGVVEIRPVGVLAPEPVIRLVGQRAGKEIEDHAVGDEDDGEKSDQRDRQRLSGGDDRRRVWPVAAQDGLPELISNQ